MPWPRMNALLGSNLRDGFFFFEEFSGHLSLERRGVVFLFGHNVSSVTLEGLPDCPNFWVHYIKPYLLPVERAVGSWMT